MTLAGLPAQVRIWLADGSDRSLAQKFAGGAFLIRVFSAGLIYLSQILLARWMGSFEFGIYVYVWTLVLMIGDLADMGLATAAQRFIPEYTRRKADELLRGYLSRSRWLAVGSATLVAAAGVLLIQFLKPYIAGYLVVPLSVALVALPFYAIMQIQDGIARSYNWIHIALLPPYVLRHLVMLVLVCAAWLLSFPANAETAVFAVGIALMVTAIGQTLVLNRKLRQTVESGPKAYDTRTWLSVSLPILFVEGFYVLLTNVDILILQQFRSPDDVAIYYAAAKTLALISFVHFAVSAAVAHRFSEYHTANDRARLEAILAELGPLGVLGLARGLPHDPRGRTHAALAVRREVRRWPPPDDDSRDRPSCARIARPGRAAAQHARRAAHLRHGLCHSLRSQHRAVRRADPVDRRGRSRGRHHHGIGR